MNSFAPATLAPALMALAVALALSASAQPAPPTTPPPKHANACFWRRDISNFAAVDQKTVYLRVGVSEVFKLDLFSDCLDLDFVHRIGLKSIGGFESNLCEGPNPGVDVVVRDVGLGHMRCPVTNITKLTPADVAALPKGARP